MRYEIISRGRNDRTLFLFPLPQNCFCRLYLPRITDSGAQELSEQIHGRDFSFHDDYALLCIFELGGLWMDKVTA
jgi:hypothetical protein